MNVVSISEIQRLDLAVQYRRAYHGTVKTEIGGTTRSNRIEFALELTALGTNDITVRFLESPEFPVVPATEVISAAIRKLDQDGGLP